ncbi:hypothetical protein THMIRHAM_19200 [Thiomicrorhabdus immobilis]|uniref:Uncharacterized protein n=1 Tax=Thiomicrorhabdus immobilis TaxID=2791037 RepID=A0ABN6CYC9_9GAMM|nr:hypothetical protein [Thiomicrorhabdus immobilis]BCN94135.1 hypothetical protein THMIRHAM_19200 [Thiomicrorhabdus immobilis]
MKSPVLLTVTDRKQQQLAKFCYWDEFEQQLYIDARKLFPNEGVVTIIGWDNMMLNAQDIPDYPSYFKIMGWPNQPQFSDWRKQIPKWVQDSCALFPSHQMTLLHYAGKYPQVLELLDHAPMLAWRLITSRLEEPEIVALLSGKRSQIAATVGWPGKAETIKFLTNLRLRWVNNEIAEQIETCLLDEQRLSALQALPRINSMALSLAARFPELIGSKLHHALAQLPCRPMQCQSMVALLEDAYRAAEFLRLQENIVDKIGQCRYLVEVSELYQAWLDLAVNQARHEKITQHAATQQHLQQRLTAEPQALHGLDDWIALSQIQQHIWLTEYDVNEQGADKGVLLAWKDEEGVWAALTYSHLPDSPQAIHKTMEMHSVLRVRGLENRLPGAKQLSTLHLWQASQLRQE